MHLTTYIAIGMMVFIYRSSKSNKKPYLLSLVASDLIVLYWVLYLFDFYAIIPESIADIIFLPAWIVFFSIHLRAKFLPPLVFYIK